MIYIWFPKDKITQEVLDLFPHTQDRQIIDIYQKFSHSKYIFVAVKGFSQESNNTLQSFLEKVKGIDNIKAVFTQRDVPQDLKDFITQNYLYVATPNPPHKVFTSQEITDKIIHGLQSMQKQLQDNTDTNTPYNTITEEKQLQDTNNPNTLNNSNISSKVNDFHQSNTINTIHANTINAYNTINTNSHNSINDSSLANTFNTISTSNNSNSYNYNTSNQIENVNTFDAINTSLYSNKISGDSVSSSIANSFNSSNIFNQMKNINIINV